MGFKWVFEKTHFSKTHLKTRFYWIRRGIFKWVFKKLGFVENYGLIKDGLPPKSENCFVIDNRYYINRSGPYARNKCENVLRKVYFSTLSLNPTNELYKLNLTSWNLNNCLDVARSNLQPQKWQNKRTEWTDSQKIKRHYLGPRRGIFCVCTTAVHFTKYDYIWWVD